VRRRRRENLEASSEQFRKIAIGLMIDYRRISIARLTNGMRAPICLPEYAMDKPWYAAGLAIFGQLTAALDKLSLGRR
jgi:hypothetical protein